MVRARRIAGLELHQCFPRHGEGARIIDRESNVDALTAIDESVALDDMHLFGMRRAEAVERALIVQSDRIDDERVAVLIMADGFALPGIAGIRAVRPVQIDTADL